MVDVLMGESEGDDEDGGESDLLLCGDGLEGDVEGLVHVDEGEQLVACAKSCMPPTDEFVGYA